MQNPIAFAFISQASAIVSRHSKARYWEELVRANCPYCLQRVDDKHFIILNRHYLPLGLSNNRVTELWENWQSHLAAWWISQDDFNPEPLNKVSDTLYYFYNDGNTPIGSRKDQEAYALRLSRTFGV